MKIPVKSLIFADLVNYSHTVGMIFIGLTPILPFFYDVIYNYKEKKKKVPSYIYFTLGFLNYGIIISYNLKNDVCLISEIENFLNPNKYEIYQVKNHTKNTLIFSSCSLFLQGFINDFTFRSLTVGSYYLFIIYNTFK